jgi:hypothetical protein
VCVMCMCAFGLPPFSFDLLLATFEVVSQLPLVSVLPRCSMALDSNAQAAINKSQERHSI